MVPESKKGRAVIESKCPELRYLKPAVTARVEKSEKVGLYES
jgi:hypothetical protein